MSSQVSFANRAKAAAHTAAMAAFDWAGTPEHRSFRVKTGKDEDTWMSRWKLGSMVTPPKFNSSPLKNGGWKTIPFLLGFGLFSGANC